METATRHTPLQSSELAREIREFLILGVSIDMMSMNGDNEAQRLRFYFFYESRDSDSVTVVYLK